MRGTLDFVNTTVIGGLLEIVPVAAIIGFAAKMIERCSRRSIGHRGCRAVGRARWRASW
jgi:hypothetical protein